MIDLHSHILPAMDDGSQSIEESILMLRMQAEQGVKVVVATPHFFANEESAKAFLKRREKSANLLKKNLPENMPQIRLGAEVQYYQGISQMKELEQLQIENSNLLLLEMPFARWDESVFRELTELSSRGKMQVVLAHIERYLPFQKASVFEELLKRGILIQVNAGYFTSLRTRFRALSLLKKGMIHFIGSDCHDIKNRPPKIAKALAIIEKKFGTNFLCQMNEFGYAMLEHK